MSEIEVRKPGAVATSEELTIDQLRGQVQLIQQAMHEVMKRGEHFGTIPGAGSKQVLFKSGAEKLCLLFRLDPQYECVETFHDDGHYTVRATCVLYHVTSGNRMGSGEGLCTTRESRYAYRKGGAAVPAEKLPDSYNTVLKMACKRAQVAAVLTATGASDIFTQDLEEATTTHQTQAPQIVPASGETLASLDAALQLVSYKPDLWGHEVVLANASRRFRRNLSALTQLSEEEAKQITTAAQQFFLTHPPQLKSEPEVEPEAEPVEGEVVEDTLPDFGEEAKS